MNRRILPRKISKQRVFAKNVQNIRRKDSYWQVYTEKIYSSFDGHTFFREIEEDVTSFSFSFSRDAFFLHEL